MEYCGVVLRFAAPFELTRSHTRYPVHSLETRKRAWLSKPAKPSWVLIAVACATPRQTTRDQRLCIPADAPHCARDATDGRGKPHLTSAHAATKQHGECHGEEQASVAWKRSALASPLLVNRPVTFPCAPTHHSHPVEVRLWPSKRQDSLTEGRECQLHRELHCLWRRLDRWIVAVHLAGGGDVESWVDFDEVHRHEAPR